MPGAAGFAVVDVLEVHLAVMFVDDPEGCLCRMPGRVGDLAAGHAG